MITALTTRRVAIDQLVPLPGNPRRTLTPDDPGWRRLVKSLDEHGYVDPLIWNAQTGHVLSGHQRLAILRARDVQEIDVVVVDVPADREMAIALAMNTHAGEWDSDLLSEALSKLVEIPQFDVEVTGFDVQKVEDLLAGIPVGDDDEEDFDLAAEIERADDPITQPGDLIELGPHRLLCGDSARAEDVDRLLDGQPIHLVNTDPPYGVKVEPRSNNAIAAGITSFSRREDLQCQRSESERGKKDRERLARKTATHHQGLDLARRPNAAKPTTKKMRAKDRPLVNDFVSDEEFDRLLLAWFGNISRVLAPGRSFYIWGGYGNLENYPRALRQVGLYFSQAIIWDKQHPVLTRKDFMGGHEFAYYGWREGAAHQFFGPNNVSDIWKVKKVPPQRMQHLTSKPVELAVRTMHYSSRRGENVLDLFGGGGSTLIGAAQTGRRAFLCEIDPAYCDVIVRRYIAYAGERAVAPEVAERYRLPEETV